MGDGVMTRRKHFLVTISTVTTDWLLCTWGRQTVDLVSPCPPWRPRRVSSVELRTPTVSRTWRGELVTRRPASSSSRQWSVSRLMESRPEGSRAHTCNTPALVALHTAHAQSPHLGDDL